MLNIEDFRMLTKNINPETIHPTFVRLLATLRDLEIEKLKGVHFATIGVELYGATETTGKCSSDYYLRNEKP